MSDPTEIEEPVAEPTASVSPTGPYLHVQLTQPNQPDVPVFSRDLDAMMMIGVMRGRKSPKANRYELLLAVPTGTVPIMAIEMLATWDLITNRLLDMVPPDKRQGLAKELGTQLLVAAGERPAEQSVIEVAQRMPKVTR